MPKVSVIIPCYNLGLYLDEAVDSVLNQTYQDFELIIVNDGSTDEYTNNLLKNYDKPKTTIYHTKNQGLPATRNFGIERSSGDYICCLDADDKYLPEFLEKCVKVLDEDTKCEYGIATTYMRIFENSQALVEITDYNPYALAVENRLHVASLFRRRCWKEVDGYKTNLIGYQDWDFWISIVAKGYKWSTVKEALFYYRDRVGSMVKNSDKKRVSIIDKIIDNNIDFYLKNSMPIIKEFVINNSNLSDYIKNLLDSKKWLEEQINNRDIEIDNQIKIVSGLKKYIDELLEAKEWFLSQLGDKDRYIDELLKNEKLLNEKYSKSNEEVKNLNNLILEYKKNIDDLREQIKIKDEIIASKEIDLKNKIDDYHKVWHERVYFHNELENKIIEREHNIEEINNLKIEKSNLLNYIRDLENNINNIYQSKTYRFGLMFKDAFKSPKKILILPLRFIWFFTPFKIKQKVRNTRLFKKVKKILIDKSIFEHLKKRLLKKYIFDFYDNFTFFTQVKEREEFITLDTISINDDTKKSVLLHPPYDPSLFAELILKDFVVPPDTVFKSSIALKPNIWLENNDGAYFYVEVESNSNPEIIFERYLDPKNNENDRRWMGVEVSLDRYKNRIVNFKLKTKNGGRENYNVYAHSIWGESRFECLSIAGVNNKYYWSKNKEHKKIKIIKNKKWSKNRPLVSVVIPCYNYGKYVEEAIDSVLNQTFQNFEIIVIDGGSSDVETIKILRQLNKPKTKIFFRKGRHLVGDNRNFGIKRAKGKYICCLDADDMIKPTYLEKAFFYLEVEGYDVVYPSVQCFGAKNDIWYAQPTDFIINIEVGNHVSTVAVFRKIAWKKSGGIKDWGLGENHVPEDWEYWTRLLGMGFRFKEIVEPLMLYRIHDVGLTSSCKMPLEKQKEIIRNEIILFLKNNKKLECIVKKTNINLKNNLNKKSIILALPFIITGGAEKILLNLVDYLTKHNYHISILTTIPVDKKFGDDTPKFEKITKEIYNLYNFLKSEDEWKAFVEYLIVTKNVKILFLVGCEFIYNILPDIKKRYPYLKIVDQLYNEYGHIMNNQKYQNLIDLNIVENEIVESALLKKYNVIEDKVNLIHNGVDLRFEANYVKDVDYEMYNIPKDKFIVAFYGRFSEEKSPDLFVEIVNFLKNNNEMFFVMGGNGPLYDFIKELIVKYELNNKILIPGFINVSEFLKITNVVIVPSRIDGRPNIVLESLAMGVPVIVSNVGGLPTLVENGYNGFVCETNNLKNFADKINDLFYNHSLYEKISDNAKNYAKDNLDINKMLNSYLTLFDRLIN